MMARYMVTHSLLSAWLYAMKDNPYEDMSSERDPMADFLSTLERVESQPTEAMQNGINFENLVTDITLDKGDPKNVWYEAASEIAGVVGGGNLQCRVSKEVESGGLTLLLYGRLDCLKGGEVYDIKFSKGYERGKYVDSTQHPMYLELVPEAKGFTYLISNGREVWSERYRRDETPSIYPVIADFLDWIKVMGLMPIYKEKWLAK